MGCSCCGITYQEEVEDQILSYIKRINKTDATKNSLIKYIKEDLLRRASTVDRYYYPYRNEDVQLTVNLYKDYIYRKLKGNFELLDDIIKNKEEKKEKKGKEEKKEEEKEYEKDLEKEREK